MKKVSLSFLGRNVREFDSYRQLFVYLCDVFIRVAFVLLFALAGILPIFISTSTTDLARYVGIYLTAIFVWGLLLVKFILVGRKIFAKTRFDIYFMGILSLILISVLVSSNRVEGVFGSFGTWSYSVLTILSVSILYYTATLVFKYLRGVKWLALSFLFSILVSGTYYSISLILGEEKGIDYVRYAVLSIPLALGMLFIFRKIYLRIAMFVVLLLNVYLAVYYSQVLSGSMFVLSIGVLVLFLLFYFSFWTKNSGLIFDFLKRLKDNVRNIKDLNLFINKNKRQFFIVLVVVFMAAWILGFGYYSLQYFNRDIGPYIGEWVKEDLEKMSGVRMWLIGSNDLSREFSSMEIMNILGNYGIITAFVFILFLGHCTYISARLVLALLYNGSFKNIILLSSVFVSFIAIFVSFILSRMTPFLYLLLIFATSLLSIIGDLSSQKDMYHLYSDTTKMGRGRKIFKTILSLAVIAIMILGMVGILSGVDNGIF